MKRPWLRGLSMMLPPILVSFVTGFLDAGCERTVLGCAQCRQCARTAHALMRNQMIKKWPKKVYEKRQNCVKDVLTPIDFFFVLEFYPFICELSYLSTCRFQSLSLVEPCSPKFSHPPRVYHCLYPTTENWPWV